MRSNIIGEKLCALCKERGITAESLSAQLAENEVQLSAEEITEIFAQRRKVCDIETAAFAECLGCTVDELF